MPGAWFDDPGVVESSRSLHGTAHPCTAGIAATPWTLELAPTPVHGAITTRAFASSRCSGVPTAAATGWCRAQLCAITTAAA